MNIDTRPARSKISHHQHELAGAAARTFALACALHVGNPRRAVAFDQKHYFGVDGNGNQTSVNPTYGQATRYQPPMAVRLGAQVGF